VPRLGMVRADTGFGLVAAMNPFDAIGTARVSHAIADRICRVVLDYQDGAAEREITTAVTGVTGEVVNFAVTLARATREHRDVRMGASVRRDPALALTGISRLYVLCPLPTAEAERAAADLARHGGGVSQPVRRLGDVAQALTRVLSS